MKRAIPHSAKTLAVLTVAGFLLGGCHYARAPHGGPHPGPHWAAPHHSDGYHHGHGGRQGPRDGRRGGRGRH